jgi:hypothetical protein
MTALDAVAPPSGSVAAGPGASGPGAGAGATALGGLLAAPEPETSALFRAGCVFERNRESGLSQEAFLRLLLDLDAGGAGSERGGPSAAVDFSAGRVFERFGSGRGEDAVLSPEPFQAALRRFGVEDVFGGGRLFERFAQRRPQHGLRGGEFQSLARASPLGSTFAVKLKMNPRLLEEEAAAHAAPQVPAANSDGGLVQLLRDALLGAVAPAPAAGSAPAAAAAAAAAAAHQQQMQVQMQQPAPHSRAALAAAVVEDQVALDEVRKRVAQVQALDRQIDAYEGEAAAEAALKATLPEAYSAGKERLLLDHVSNLKDKRRALLQALKRLKRQQREREAEHFGIQGPAPPAYPYAAYEVLGEQSLVDPAATGRALPSL